MQTFVFKLSPIGGIIATGWIKAAYVGCQTLICTLWLRETHSHSLVLQLWPLFIGRRGALFSLFENHKAFMDNSLGLLESPAFNYAFCACDRLGLGLQEFLITAHSQR